MSDLRLVIFDVDGTLVDSQNVIFATMVKAFAEEGLTAPERSAVLGIVGLSLPIAVGTLDPTLGEAKRDRVVKAYKANFAAHRTSAGAGAAPLYDGALDALKELHAEPSTLLAVATGKSRRGLDALLEAHDLERFFISRQTADTHPSKPHPSMIETCLADAGVAPDRAVMVGDTSFDMDMARAGRVAALGVSWGYHDTARLGADVTIDAFHQLPSAVHALLEPRA